MRRFPFLVVMGLGKSGQAVASFARRRKIPHVIVDDKPDLAKTWVSEQGYRCDVLDGRKDLSFFDTI